MHEFPDGTYFDPSIEEDRELCDALHEIVRYMQLSGDYRLTRGLATQPRTRDELAVDKARHAAGMAIDASLQSSGAIIRPLDRRLSDFFERGTPLFVRVDELVVTTAVTAVWPSA